MRCSAAIFLILLPACGGDDATQRPDFGFQPDFRTTFSDLGRRDFVAPRLDGRPDLSPQDSGNTGGCQTVQASCTVVCKPDELCTEAGGGTCTKIAALVGKAGSTAVLSAIALAYAQCWGLQASGDALCATFDTCGLEGELSAAAVRTWICDKSQIVHFPTTDDRDNARSAVGCELWQVQRVEWSVGNVEPKKRGMICVGYNNKSLIFDDRVPVTECKGYPYP